MGFSVGQEWLGEVVEVHSLPNGRASWALGLERLALVVWGDWPWCTTTGAKLSTMGGPDGMDVVLVFPRRDQP